ncbi:hypothetical protein Anapl_17631 [Anas platyrhynchos]|uniref:Uncharacterized protein n=1 Tax=Anas platyrhynchos TaxID=8839 RepID=R0L0G5_ANAPL|nr:hypothetical protein Anapl_17631 [Anas platyrhynchos]
MPQSSSAVPRVLQRLQDSRVQENARRTGGQKVVVSLYRDLSSSMASRRVPKVKIVQRSVVDTEEHGGGLGKPPAAALCYGTCAELANLVLASCCSGRAWPRWQDVGDTLTSMLQDGRGVCKRSALLCPGDRTAREMVMVEMDTSQALISYGSPRLVLP